MEQIARGFQTSNEGWQFMWLILAMGGASFGLMIERFLFIVLKSSKGRKGFMANLANLLKAEKFAEAANFAKSGNTPLSRVMSAILENRDKGEKGMTDAMDEVFLTEAPRINRYLAVLATMANLSTLLGLLGTIYGLIYTFDAVANKPAAERPTALADGIAVAMGTTFMGLVVAIPCLAAQGYFNMVSERLVEEMEEKGLKVIHLL
jgi:biopolymer transport protein ExbB/TolQ